MQWMLSETIYDNIKFYINYAEQMKIDGLDVILEQCESRFLHVIHVQTLTTCSTLVNVFSSLFFFPLSSLRLRLRLCECVNAESLNIYFMRVMKTTTTMATILADMVLRCERMVEEKNRAKRSAISQNENTDILFASGLL